MRSPRYDTGGAPLRLGVLASQMLPPIVLVLPLFALFLRRRAAQQPRRHRHRASRHQPAVPRLDAGRLLRGRDARSWRRRRAIDGATRLQAFTRIAVPVAAPGILAAGLLGFILSWNEFLFALILSGSSTPDAAGRSREPRDACAASRSRRSPRPRCLALAAGVRAAAVPAPIPDQGAVARSAEVTLMRRSEANEGESCMTTLLLATPLAAGSRTGAGRDRQHPDGGRARHRIRQGRCCRSSRQADRHRRQARGRQLRRDAHQAGAAAGRAGRAATTAIVVDFYWVGEFTKAGWLQPLDERIAADKVDTSVYVPALMDLVGKVDGVTYMLPFYNYAMGLTLPQGPAGRPEEPGGLQGQVRHGAAVPETWDEYLKQVEFFTKDGIDFTASSTRACGPTRSPWNGRTTSSPMAAEYYDEQLEADARHRRGRQGARATTRPTSQKYGPLGAASFSFDEAFNVDGPGQGLQLHHLQLLPRRLSTIPSKSAGGRQGRDHAGPGSSRQGGSLNGAWGWAIPKSSPNPDAAWTFLKWIE